MRDIPGFAGRYAVTENGEVWSYEKIALNRKHPAKFLKKTETYRGYLNVNLVKNGKAMTRGIHVLVAKTYIPNPHNLPQVNHKNGKKSENQVENLEWCTRQGNMLHAHKIGLYRKSFKLPTKQMEEIKRLRANGVKLKVLATRFNVHRSTISRIISRC